jgi:hypothetical protein
VLSAAKIGRAVLAECAVADVPLGEQPTEEAIAALVAGVFKESYVPAAAQIEA